MANDVPVEEREPPTPVWVTPSMLERALRRWEEESRAGAWPERSDDERHADNAEYLLGLLVSDPEAE